MATQTKTQRKVTVYAVETCRGGRHWERYGTKTFATHAEAEELAKGLEEQGAVTNVRATRCRPERSTSTCEPPAQRAASACP